MKIGILTSYKEINFGANLQAFSTYRFLLSKGHTPIFIYYYSEEKYNLWGLKMENEVQPKCHKEFVDEYMPSQTERCNSVDDINNVIIKYGIEAIIVGSDAVVQHQALLQRIRLSRHKIINIIKELPDNSFPNPYWGCGILNNIKMAMMSVSCQDSEPKYYSKQLKNRMRDSLSRFEYISARDERTQVMFKEIIGDSSTKIPITPDPVFAFNQNAGSYVPLKKDILKEYCIPDNYILFSFHKQVIRIEDLLFLKQEFLERGIECVALPMPFGCNYSHPFNYEIKTPLSPINWYALIKYSSGYIGNNMHPIVVALHNSVPCYSIDHWGSKNFWGCKNKRNTSKVLNILKRYCLESNYYQTNRGYCSINMIDIVNGIVNFPREAVKNQSNMMLSDYNQMMDNILEKLCQ